MERSGYWFLLSVKEEEGESTQTQTLCQIAVKTLPVFTLVLPCCLSLCVLPSLWILACTKSKLTFLKAAFSFAFSPKNNSVVSQSFFSVFFFHTYTHKEEKKEKGQNQNGWTQSFLMVLTTNYWLRKSVRINQMHSLKSFYCLRNNQRQMRMRFVAEYSWVQSRVAGEWWWTMSLWEI